MTSVAGSPGRSASAAPGTSLRDALLAIGVLLTLLVLVEVAVPGTSRASVAEIVDGVAVAAFTITGLLAWHRRPHNATGRLMVATAVALWAAGMQDDEIEVLRHVGVLLDALPLALLMHLLLAFPSGRLVGRAARVTVAVAYTVSLVPPVAQDLVGPGDIATAIEWTQTVVGLTTMVVTFVLASRRLATTPAVVRRQLLPFLGYGCFAVAVILICIAITHTNPSVAVLDAVLIVQLAMLCGIPIAFVVALTVGAFGRAGEVEEVALGIAEAVRRASPARRPHGPRVGRPAAPGCCGRRDRTEPASSTATGRRARSSAASGGGPSARVRAGRRPPLRPDAHRRHRRRLDRRRTAGARHRQPEARRRPPGRRPADSTSRPREIRTSRRRIVVAADAERRRIARDLHDGAQQRIVLAGLEVQRIARRAEDADFVRTVGTRLTEQMRTLLDELRALVQGIMPTTLQERGLHAGVIALADQMPMPVRVDVVGPSTGWTPRSSRPATSSLPRR